MASRTLYTIRKISFATSDYAETNGKQNRGEKQRIC